MAKFYYNPVPFGTVVKPGDLVFACSVQDAPNATGYWIITREAHLSGAVGPGGIDINLDGSPSPTMKWTKV